MRTKITKNIPALISAILAGAAGLAHLLNLGRPFSYFSSLTDSSASALFWAFAPVMGLLIALVTLVLAFVRFSKALNVIIIALGFVLVPILGTLNIVLLIFEQNLDYVSFELLLSLFWSTYDFDSIVSSLSNVLWVLALIAAVVSLLVKPKVAVANVEVATQSAPVANQFDPMTGERIAPAPAPAYVAPAPNYVAPAAGLAPSNLPMFALILAFFAPVGAVIVGHIALNQMKQGQISSENLGMAKTGLILGYVFTGLGVILGIILGVLYGLAMSLSY